MCERSTASVLAGEELAHVRPFQSVDSAIAGLTDEQRTRWRIAMTGYGSGHRLLPASGSVFAFWYVDPSTGALLGVLESGAGGGETIQLTDEMLGTMLDVAGRIGNAAGAAGILSTAGGTWLTLEIIKLKKLLGATVVISGGTPMGDPTDWSDFGCAAALGAASLAGEAAGGLAAEAADVVGKADGVLGAATGSGLCG